MGNNRSVPTLNPATRFPRQGHLLCPALQYFTEWLRNLKDKIGIDKNISEGLINVSQIQLL